MTEQNWLADAYAQTDAAAGIVDDISENWRFEGDKLVCHRVQDVEPYLDFNKASYNETPTWRPWANVTMRPIANIPNVVIEQWIREGFNLFDESRPGYQTELKRRLNDISNRHLRLAPGRL